MNRDMIMMALAVFGMLSGGSGLVGVINLWSDLNASLQRHEIKIVEMEGKQRKSEDKLEKLAGVEIKQENNIKTLNEVKQNMEQVKKDINDIKFRGLQTDNKIGNVESNQNRAIETQKQILQELKELNRRQHAP